MKSRNDITRLLPYGGVGTIAKKLGITPSAASSAIRRGAPSHPAIKEALRMIEESGVLDTAKALASLPTA